MRYLLVLALACGPREGVALTGKISAPEGASQKRLRTKLYGGPPIAGHKDPDPSPAVVWLEGAAPAAVKPVSIEIRQEGLEFRPRVVALPVGSKIAFPNGDNLFHNVFSYSKACRFDLGRYPQGESKSVTFETKGQVDLRCEVHNHMRGFIFVFDHPYFAVAREDGSYSIPDVPPGKYTLVAQKEFFDPVRKEIEIAGNGSSVDLTLARHRDGSAGPAARGLCCGTR